MKKIEEIIADYSTNLNEVEKSNLTETNKIIESIKLSVLCLGELRLLLKKNNFSTIESEINFFKYQKPFVYGRARYYSQLQKFQTDKPKSNIHEQRYFIKMAIKKLEIKKYKQLEFFRYCKNSDKRLDQIYFLRGNEQLEVYVDTARLNVDPQFSTSHCKKAAEIIEYDLLTSFYELELNNLLTIENNLIVKEVKPAILQKLRWTASKTALSELVISLHSLKAIGNGEVELNKIVAAVELIFDINLGNIHKVFDQIRAREKDPTKFLDSLKYALIKKINSKL